MHVSALRVLRLSSLPELFVVREQALRDPEPTLELSGTVLRLRATPLGALEGILQESGVLLGA
eukprot:12306586-Alexandrium_andersonii.AAC.1